MAATYILNVIERVGHRRAGLSEQCNTDQIVKRRNSDTLPKTYRQCEHCKARPSSPVSESMAFPLPPPPPA